MSMQNQPLNEDYLTQAHEDVFDIAQVAVDLAVAVLTSDESVVHQALDVVVTYGDWRTIKLSPKIRRLLYVLNYGEDEVQAMEESGEVTF